MWDIQPIFLLIKRDFKLFIGDAPIGEAAITGTDETISPVVYVGSNKKDSSHVKLMNKDFGLFADKKTIGWGGLSFKNHPRAWLHSFCITEAYCNRGYGSFLLTNLINVAKNDGCSKIELWVRRENYIAIHLYEKFGFSRSIEQRYESGWNYDLVIHKEPS